MFKKILKVLLVVFSIDVRVVPVAVVAALGSFSLLSIPHIFFNLHAALLIPLLLIVPLIIRLLLIVPLRLILLLTFLTLSNPFLLLLPPFLTIPLITPSLQLHSPTFFMFFSSAIPLLPLLLQSSSP